MVLEDTLAINVNPDDPNEFDNNNYKARPIQILGKAKPVFDFALTSVEAPDAVAGSPLTVKWTVQNRGDRVEGTWFDSVWLSSTPDFSSPSNEQWFLGTVQRSGSLETGQSYSAEQTFDLAPSVTRAVKYPQYSPGGLINEGGGISCGRCHAHRRLLDQHHCFRQRAHGSEYHSTMPCARGQHR